MPRHPAPLPDDIPATFLPADLTAARLSLGRARRTDLVRVDRGVYRDVTRPPTSWSDLGLPEPPHGWDRDRLLAVQRLRPDAVLSHETAAHLHGFPTPPRPWRAPASRRAEAAPAPVSVSVPRDGSRVRRNGVRTHRRALPGGHVTRLHGLAVTTLARTWADLCALGPPWLLDDLIAAGDHCVKRPWLPGGGRGTPLETPEGLGRTLRQVGRFAGVVTARHALEHVRVGADSAPETRLRLALIDAGAGEPRLQHPLDPTDPVSPDADLAYPLERISLQYDGLHHRTPEQQARDARRERYALARGWHPLRATAADLREGFRSLTAEVCRRRRERGAHLPSPPLAPLGRSAVTS